MVKSVSGTPTHSLTDLVQAVMIWPLRVKVATGSIAFRCGKPGCDEEIVRYVKTQVVTMESISHKLLPHMKTCLASRRVYPE